MSNHTYRVIEIVGSSPDGIDAAIRSGLARAAQTMRGLDWFEVESIRGHLADGAIAHFQVTMKVGFRLEDSQSEHWGKVGLEPIEAVPKLVGQTTSADALDEARDALADVADVEITVTVSELSTEARRQGPRITRVEQGGQLRDLRGRQRQAPCQGFALLQPTLSGPGTAACG